MNIYTKKLTAGQSFTITADYKCAIFSFQVSGGSGDNATYLGAGTNPVDGTASGTIPITAGQGRTFTSNDSSGRPIQGITVACVAGTVGIDIWY